MFNCPSSAASRIVIGTSNGEFDDVVFSNNTAKSYGGAIYTSNKSTVMIYGKVKGTVYNYYFKTDIRSDELTHVAFTMDGSIINLYVDGVLKETVDMGTPISYCHTEMFIGGDGRATGDQIFKGKIYAVNIFEDIRTDEEIKQDVLWVASNADGLLYQKSFGN